MFSGWRKFFRSLNRAKRCVVIFEEYDDHNNLINSTKYFTNLNTSNEDVVGGIVFDHDEYDLDYQFLKKWSDKKHINWKKEGF